MARPLLWVGDMQRPVHFAPLLLTCLLVPLACGDDSTDNDSANDDAASDSDDAADGSDGADGADGADDVNDDGADDDSAGDDGSDGGDDGPSVDDDYAQTLMSAMWAADITIEIGDETIDFGSDGYPEHDVLEAYGLMDGTTVAVADSNTAFSIPIAPEYSDTVTDAGMGTIGFAISGAVYFNPYEGDGTSVALDNNFDVGGVPFLDACNGHPLPDGGTYHYHGVPYCITDDLDVAGDHSSLIGVLLDGFPVYGPNGEGGAAATDLDECSGHDGATPEFPNGVYHYHLTETAPYSVTCYHGVVQDTGGGGMMPPPGGG